MVVVVVVVVVVDINTMKVYKCVIIKNRIIKQITKQTYTPKHIFFYCLINILPLPLSLSLSLLSLSLSLPPSPSPSLLSLFLSFSLSLSFSPFQKLTENTKVKWVLKCMIDKINYDFLHYQVYIYNFIIYI